MNPNTKLAEKNGRVSQKSRDSVRKQKSPDKYDLSGSSDAGSKPNCSLRSVNKGMYIYLYSIIYIKGGGRIPSVMSN